jgi:hypothetical protein
VPAAQLAEVRRGIESYHRVKEHLEEISDINRELLRREKSRKPSQEKPRK